MFQGLVFRILSVSFRKWNTRNHVERKENWDTPFDAVLQEVLNLIEKNSQSHWSGGKDVCQWHGKEWINVCYNLELIRPFQYRISEKISRIRLAMLTFIDWKNNVEPHEEKDRFSVFMTAVNMSFALCIGLLWYSPGWKSITDLEKLMNLRIKLTIPNTTTYKKCLYMISIPIKWELQWLVAYHRYTWVS